MRQAGILLAMALTLGGAAVFGASRSSDEETAGRRTPDAPQGVEAKLDRILQRQEEILQRFDEVMKELQIVKIRATQR